MAVQQGVGPVPGGEPWGPVRRDPLGERGPTVLSCERGKKPRRLVARDRARERPIEHLPRLDTQPERPHVALVQPKHTRRDPEGLERDPILLRLRPPRRHKRQLRRDATRRLPDPDEQSPRHRQRRRSRRVRSGFGIGARIQIQNWYPQKC